MTIHSIDNYDNAKLCFANVLAILNIMWVAHVRKKIVVTQKWKKWEKKFRQ